MDALVRKSRMEDVKQIHTLLGHFADKGLLLGRALSTLYDQVRDFHVVVKPHSGKGEDTDEEILGVCALHICWENLAEIRSLAILEQYQGRGFGRRLVEECIKDALGFGINRIFTLTYQPGFFQRLGFKEIDKKELPHKVWSDCIHCPKFPDCNEEAMIWEQG